MVGIIKMIGVKIVWEIF